MAILYVTEQGATIRHLAGRVVVRREDRIISEVPDFKCEAINCFGNINVTSGLMNFCFEQGVPVSFLSTSGKFRGSLQARMAKNGLLRLKQYERVTDPQFCLRNAAAIVAGKIKNMIAMVRRQRRLRDEGRSPIAELEAILPKLPTATSLESLNGFEGAASAAYFRVFRLALKEDWGFKTRQYHPSDDPVNALLSFGYTLLHNDVDAAINVAGLDPYLGVFHRPRLGHATLASDLQEEYRAAVIDRMVLTALNKRILVPGDFIPTPEQRLRLAPIALKRFLELYAQQMNEPVLYARQNIRTTYRQIIEWQVRQFAKCVTGEAAVYQPHLVALDPVTRESD